MAATATRHQPHASGRNGDWHPRNGRHHMTDPQPATGQGDSNTSEAPAASQEQPEEGTDWRAQATRWREQAREQERRAKENATARKELDELKAAQMTEQQRLEQRAITAEARVAALERDHLRMLVAAEKRLPPEMVGRLQGDTREELEADADVLAGLLVHTNGSGGQTPPPPRLDMGQGARGGMTPPMSADEWLRGQARRR